MARVVTTKPTDRQRNEAWRAKWAAHYTPDELDRIDRHWTSLGKKIANGARIADRKLGRPVKKR